MQLRAESRELRAAFGLLFAVGLLAGSAPAAEVRAAPTRPPPVGPTVPKAAAIATERTAPTLLVTKIRGIEYYSVADIARRLNLKAEWSILRRDSILSGAGARISLEANGREASINGIRLHLGDPTVLQRGLLYVSRIDYEHSILPRARPDLVGSPPRRPQVIAIDAGHGGKDDGSPNTKFKIVEKDMALDIALRLQKQLVAAGYKVVMTRDDDQVGTGTDEFIRRSEVVNRAGADLLVSIHLNSVPSDTRTDGTEVYVYTPTSQRSTESWQAKDPDQEPMAFPANRFDAWSAVLSHNMQRAVTGALKTTDRGEKTKHSAILKRLNCPSVLVESVFISNDAEAQRLAQPEYREKIASAILAGIRGYETALGAEAR